MLYNKQVRVVVVGLIIFFFANSIAFGQGFKKSRFDLKLSVASIYDDNILKYSDKYIDRFLNNEDEGRFEINTYDDVYIKSKISTSYYFKFFKKKKTKISASFNNNSYVNNPIKTWNYYGVGIQQYFLKKANVKFSYSYIPAFYVRQFRQYDLVDMYGYEPITFKPYVFSKDNYSLTFQNTFKKTKVEIDFDRALYYHNSYYTEYDSKNLSAGLSLEQPVSKKVKIKASYVYTYSDAKGFDEYGETKETSDDSDATYTDHTFGIELKAKLPKVLKKKNSVSLKAKYSKRYFSSEHLIHNDALHVGRIDKNTRLYLTYNIRYSKKINFSLYYNYFIRDSYNNKGIYDEIISEDKDYKQNQIGFQVSYALF
jgi:hypothetical protein